MTTFVLGVEDVHAGANAPETAAPGGDASARDGADALNVVSVRLATAEVRTRRFDDGNGPAADLLRCADEADADEIVLGFRERDPEGEATPKEAALDGATLGGTVREVLLRSSRPVVVVPLDLA